MVNKQSAVILWRTSSQQLFCGEQAVSSYSVAWLTNYLCTRCISNRLKVSMGFMTATHAAVVKACMTPTEEVTKHVVINRQIEHRVVVPSDMLVTQSRYLKSLKDTDKVKVQVLDDVAHGLIGKSSNNRRAQVEAMFIQWVQQHRSPTGRTPDSHGIYHGAEYHLSSIFRATVKQRGKRASNSKYANYEIMSEVFCAGLPLSIRNTVGKQKPPSAGHIGSDWFPRLFGKPGSSFGHTTICPMETDKCAYCCQLKLDENSLRKSIERHKQQGDLGNIERQTGLVAAEKELTSITQEQSNHRKQCNDAEEDYKAACKDAHDRHKEICVQWELLLQSWCNNNLDQVAAALESTVIDMARKFTLVIASDYQEEKLIPSWKKSPQPGPTFFLSKRNIHVHIIDAPSLGVNSTESRLAKRVIYNRLETVGGSKDSNDTVSTIFDFLFSPVEPTCAQPALYRTGYGPDGALEASANPDDDAPPQLGENDTNPDGNAAPQPDLEGFPSAYQPSPPPPEDQLEFRSDTGSALIGATIYFKWPEEDGGWCFGSIFRQNMDRRYKDNKELVNFFLEFAEDNGGEEMKHALSLASYIDFSASPSWQQACQNAPDGSWCLCAPAHVSAQTSAPHMYQTQPATSLSPDGYAPQNAPPTMDSLEFGNDAGTQLLNRKIHYNWGSDYGWCVGEIIGQNHRLNVTIDHKHVNFIVQYPNDPECKHVLCREDYCTSYDAPEGSWLLLMRCEAEPSGGGSSYSAGELSVTGTHLHPNPFVREIRWNMDNCGATNKNQYVFGSVSIAASLAVVDAVMIDFMKAGHTKFQPDYTARHTAGRFNSEDTFNCAQWLQHCQHYASACFYDGSMLRTWKEAAPEVFRSVHQINSYHSFYLVADDCEMQLEPLAPSTVDCMADYLEKEKGEFYSHDSLVAEIQKLKARSLPGVIQAVRENRFHGVGAGRMRGDPQFFPPNVKQLRKVRLFKRLHQTDGIWIEQSSYQKSQDLSVFCVAVSKAIPYKESTIPGQCQKPYWGQRQQNIIDQYAKYVPAQFVEDEFNLSTSGCSSRLTAAAMEFIHPQTLVVAASEAAAMEGQQVDADGSDNDAPAATKYTHSVHGPLILEACGGAGSTKLKKKDEIKKLADQLGLEYKQVKYGLTKLVASGDLID